KQAATRFLSYILKRIISHCYCITILIHSGMQKKLLFLFLLGSLAIHCQNSPVIDSLKNKIRSDKNDSDRVNTLNDLSWEYYLISDYPASLNYCKEGLSLAKKINYRKGIANCLVAFGLVYSDQGDNEKALE